eukprot:361941-Chlamydomonas_euryale.AAC.3
MQVTCSKTSECNAMPCRPDSTGVEAQSGLRLDQASVSRHAVTGSPVAPQWGPHAGAGSPVAPQSGPMQVAGSPVAP